MFYNLIYFVAMKVAVDWHNSVLRKKRQNISRPQNFELQSQNDSDDIR